MNKSLTRIITLTRRNLKEIIRDPLSLIFTILMPLLMEVLFYILFHGLTSQFEMKYLAPGIVVFSEAFLTLFTGMLISIDRNTSFLTRLYVSKTKPYEFILSYALAVIPITVIQSILFFGVGIIFDPSLLSIRLLFGILLSIVTSVLFISFGLLFGSICDEKSIGGVSSIIIVSQSVLSGMWFPLEGISEVMMKIMEILPFRNGTLLIQNIIIGYNDLTSDILIPLVIILVYSVVVSILAIIVFKKKMKG